MNLLVPGVKYILVTGRSTRYDCKTGPKYSFSNYKLITVDSSGKMHLIHNLFFPQEFCGAVIIPKDRITPDKYLKRLDYKHNHIIICADDSNNIGKNKILVRDNGNIITIYIICGTDEKCVCYCATNTDILVQYGATVNIIITNLDGANRQSQGFCIAGYNISFIIVPGETVSFTFIADKKGVYRFYNHLSSHIFQKETNNYFIIYEKKETK